MAMPPFASDGNTALTPLPASERLFGWRDHAALWLSLGVGLLVMQIGAHLVPALGTQAALTVIACSSALDCWPGPPSSAATAAWPTPA